MFSLPSLASLILRKCYPQSFFCTSCPTLVSSSLRTWTNAPAWSLTSEQPSVLPYLLPCSFLMAAVLNQWNHMHERKGNKSWPFQNHSILVFDRPDTSMLAWYRCLFSSGSCLVQWFRAWPLGLAFLASDLNSAWSCAGYLTSLCPKAVWNRYADSTHFIELLPKKFDTGPAGRFSAS